MMYAKVQIVKQNLFSTGKAEKKSKKIYSVLIIGHLP